jgi:ABC-type polysaccharide/polyol phosphate export permease
MNEQKQHYLLRIRSQSAYPWIRRLSTFVAFIFYSIALFMVVIAFGFFGPAGLLAIPVAFLFVIAGAVLKEASILLADIADSVTDLNCRYEQ